LYFMFMGPAEQGGDFRDTGMEGMRRWIDRVYRVISSNMTNLPNSINPRVENELNKLIKKAEVDFESRHYNTIIAKMMEFINLISNDKYLMTNDQIKKFLVILAPFAPHLSEELYSNLTNNSNLTNPTSIHQQPWPIAGQITEDSVQITIMINGKLRGILNLESRILNQGEIENLAKEKVAKYLENQTIKKVIYVPGRVINFVI